MNFCRFSYIRIAIVLCLCSVAWQVQSRDYVKVVDGDSLEIGRRRIRLLGIDAPEYRQFCFDAQKQKYECGKESRAYLDKMLKKARYKVDCRTQKTDIYKRELAECFIGKTTTIGKLAAKLQKQYQISFIAGDTFRAAAVEQLEEWGRRCKIRVHKGANGCDAAGLCFDGLQEAIRQHDDIVFIDTAGRLQNKVGLMDELKKIIKVIAKVIPDAPHAVLLTLDATTGQNALAQIKTFKEAAPVSGLIITKLDGSSKGGILVAMAQETAVPIHYIGVGEQIDDLDEFNAHDFSRSLLELGSNE